MVIKYGSCVAIQEKAQEEGHEKNYRPSEEDAEAGQEKEP
jgi:hypothetical protein